MLANAEISSPALVAKEIVLFDMEISSHRVRRLYLLPARR
jgi:hypothetical protein